MATTLRGALRLCGFNGSTIHYLNAIGLDMDNLADYTNKDYKTLVDGIKTYELPDDWDTTKTDKGPLIIPPHALRKLRGFQRWITFCSLRNQKAQLKDWNEDLCKIWSDREALLVREAETEENTSAPDKPEKLSKLKKWKDFDRRLKVYLNQVRGATSAHLVYLTRSNQYASSDMLVGAYVEEVDDIRELLYDTIEDALYKTINFKHPLAMEDNRKFYFILLEAFLGGEAAVYCTQYSKSMDGRKAYIAARRAATGDAAKNTDVAQANMVIQTYKFSGEKRNYTFENHVTKFLNAYHELSEHNNPVAAETQVQQFLASITDRRLIGVKPVVLASPLFSTSLNDCAAFFRSNLAGFTKEQNAESRRSVAAMDSSGFKGRITARNYSKEEFATFTKEQREQLRKLRKDKREKEGQKKRKAGKVVQEEPDDDNEHTRDDKDGSSPSDQFGRAGDKSKKSKTQH